VLFRSPQNPKTPFQRQLCFYYLKLKIIMNRAEEKK
jgi:hypothetical protein